MIRVEGPDGTIAEFPPDTTPDVIKSAMAKRFGGPQAAPADAGIRGARRGILANIDAGIRGAADIATFGFADEIAAGMDAGLNPLLGTGKDGGSFGERYEKNVADQRAIDEADSENRFGSRIVGQGLGVIGSGIGLAKAGLSAGARAFQSGASLPRVALGSAVDGGVTGALSGAGAGETTEERIDGAGVGGILGGAIGGVAPYAVAGVQAVGAPLLAPLMARLRPDAYANKAVGDALKRSGKGADDVVEALASARADGQGMFNIADALGNAGQRMLSTASRVPHDSRQQVVEALVSRQAGQGRRLQGALAEGFGAPDTAAQRVAGLTASRDEAANRAYEMARYGLTPDDFQNAVTPGNMSTKQYLDTLPKPRVDVRSVIAGIDERIGPMQGSGVTGDGIDATLAQFRNRLTAPADKLPDGVTAVDLSDFDRVLGVKKDLGDAIEVARRAGQKYRARELGKIQSALDKALEEASPAYRTANDQFASASRVIEAVDQGKNAAMRGRVEDTVPSFRNMQPKEQQAFRAGYVDPYIADIQKTAGPMSNRARPLITDATAVEFPVFAQPGKGGQMMNRIGREQTMFETANAALGGSKTADNLADAADMNRLDPGVISNLVRGRPIDAVVSAIAQVSNEAKGMPPRVIEQVARALIETDPAMAQKILQSGSAKSAANDKVRAVVNAMITQAAAGATGRLVVP